MHPTLCTWFKDYVCRMAVLRTSYLADYYSSGGPLSVEE